MTERSSASSLLGERELKDFALADRPCDCCGSTDLQPMWMNEYTARTRSAEFRFRNQNVVCRRCGFAFVSPCPRQEDLDRYYADALAHYSGQPPASDVDSRVEQIRSRVPAGLQGIEIGGNRLVNDDRIRSYFRTFDHVELNEEIASRYSRIDDVPSDCADVLIHYYVLEHARDPGLFLRHCHRILRPNGLMICEVPDLKLFPRFVSEYLYWEHVSHFSTVTLARIAAVGGFSLRDIAHRCSNERGFLAVFSRRDEPVDVPPVDDPIEYIDAVASLRDSRALVDAFNAEIERTRREIDEVLAGGGAVTLWGATEVLRRLLQAPYSLGPNAIVVDDDPRKADFVAGVRVRRPDDVRDHLSASSLLVVATSRLAEIICKRAESLSGAGFAPRVRILDYEQVPARA